MAIAPTLLSWEPTLKLKSHLLCHSPQFPPPHASFPRIKPRKNVKKLSFKCFFTAANTSGNESSVSDLEINLGEMEIKQNPIEIVARTIVKAIKALRKPAAAAVLVACLLMYDPSSALAASGGRIGGNSFSSRSSMSSSRSYSTPRMTTGSGFSYSVPYYAPSPFGGGFASPLGGVFVGPAVGIAMAFFAFVMVSSFLSDSSEGSVLTATDKTSVLKLQVWFYWNVFGVCIFHLLI